MTNLRRQAPTPDMPRQPNCRNKQTDPWRGIDTESHQDNGPWLLSYLDVMTLLFSMFVMLFAYQKAQNADLARIAHTSTPASDAASHKIATERNSTAPSPPTISAIASMKSQSELHEVARAVMSPSVSDENPVRPNQLQPAMNVIARVGQSLVTDAIASEQTVAQLTSVLKDETKRKNVDISRSEKELRMEISDTILFDAGSATLRREGVDILTRMVPVLIHQPGTISVEGHSDNIAISTGQFPSNWELSGARASSVTRYLIQQGLAPNRLKAVGMADTHPRNDNSTPEGRAHNRRVSLVIYLDSGNG